MDVLTEVFAALRLEAGLYFSTCFRGDFAVRLAAEQRRIRFHLVLEGACVVTVPEERQVSVAQGELVLIPDGAPQTLSSGEDVSQALDLDEVLSRAPPLDGVLEFGEQGPSCRILCGFLRFDEAIDHPVLKNLPAVIALPHSDCEMPAGAIAALDLLRAETREQAPGQAAIVLRAVEILLMQVARQRLAGRADEGFAVALADPRLGKALSVIHAQPARQWTLDTLAGHAGMSRSRFAQRFMQRVGLTPVAYLTQWRMIRARQLLTEPGLDMAEIAEQCGYRSVPAFGRRFAQVFGVGPGQWRRSHRAMS